MRKSPKAFPAKNTKNLMVINYLQKNWIYSIMLTTDFQKSGLESYFYKV